MLKTSIAHVEKISIEKKVWHLISALLKLAQRMVLKKSIELCQLSFFEKAYSPLAAELWLSGKIFVDRPESYSATHSKNCIFIAHKKLRTVWT